ncbi:MAG: hypothetical protein U9Q30_00330 [Campylobacterota bacterium]|nr:hypothetical protein [Campylobacterota bacterium]
MQSELYKSSSSLVIKDLSSSASPAVDLGIFSKSVSTSSQDFSIMEKYLRSYEVYNKIDKKYNLSSYYQSDKIDILNRIIIDTNSIKLLEKYNKNIEIVFDEVSSIINISFYHTNPKIAYDIMKDILGIAEEQLNILNKTNSQKILSNITLRVKETKNDLYKSISILEKYQNKNNLIDPQIQIEQKNTLISSLQSTLIQKQVEYTSLLNYTGKNNLEVKQLESHISILKDTIKNEKSSLSGDSKETINKLFFEFEKLKSQVDFNKEIYKQTLAQYESMKVETTQNSKTLQIIVNPKLSDAYISPDKLKNIITYLILLLVLFATIYLLKLIIKDHQD